MRSTGAGSFASSQAAITPICASAIHVATSDGVATAVAIAFWSLDLARERGVGRYVGLIGFAVIAAIMALIFVVGQIGPAAIVVAGLLQALWFIAIAVLLAIERASPRTSV